MTLIRRGAALVASAAVLALPCSASAARPLVTGVQDFDFTQTHFDRVKASGSNVVKIVVPWKDVAPNSPPAAFNPTDPHDPAYSWEPFDSQIRAAVATGLRPLVTVEQSPPWAERDKRGTSGAGNPDPLQFGLFGEAIARRYSGTVAGLPRVAMFEAWNEPNASFFLFPQRNDDGSNFSPTLYREMVNRFATGVHRVHADNVVVAGALFPFTLNRQSSTTIGPYRFMRELLCLSAKLKVMPRLRAARAARRVEPPPLYIGRPDPQGGAPRQHLARRPAAHAQAPEDRGAQAADRSRAAPCGSG